nr:lipid A deacylase LpxR family protein [Microbulbifer guangxiensis]
MLLLAGQSPLVNGSSLSLELENDSFDGASDAYYSQGLQLSYAPEKPLLWPAQYLPWIFAGKEVQPRYFLGQAIFTPYEIAKTELIEDDRPYAGWLYLGMAIAAERFVPESQLKIVERFDVSAGIIGPSSGADTVQRWTHELVDTYEVNGWHNQLQDEPAFVASYLRKWAYIREFGSSDLNWEFSATAGGSVGNVTTQLIAGAGVRVGRNLYSTVGIHRAPPAISAPAFTPGMQGGDWYFFVENQQRFIDRDIFLDGNTHKESHSVDKEPRVGEWRFGLAFGLGRYQWAIYHARRSQEFEAQYVNASFSGLGLAMRF